MIKKLARLFRRIHDVLRKWYIVHEDIQTPENGMAIFGPFRGWEIDKRLNDEYADLLAACGPLEGMAYPRSYIKTVYVNSRKYWMTQLKEYDRG